MTHASKNFIAAFNSKSKGHHKISQGRLVGDRSRNHLGTYTSHLTQVRRIGMAFRDKTQILTLVIGTKIGFCYKCWGWTGN